MFASRSKTHSAVDILGPLVDNVTVGIGLDKAARGGTQGTSHVGDQEATGIG